jgi:hypothetical protein
MNAIVVCDDALAEVMDQEAKTARDVQYITGSGQVVKLKAPSIEDMQQMHDNLTNQHNALDLHGTAQPDHFSREGLRQRENLHNETYMEQLIKPMFPDDFPEEQVTDTKHKALDEDGTYHYIAMDDLPLVGRTDAPYKVATTGDLYKYVSGQYLTFNPYAEVGFQLSVPRVVIEDDTAHMPTGGKGPLSIIYNVHALRRDLYMKGVMNWTYMDMVPKGLIAPSDQLEKQRSIYFRHSHKALVEQLRTQLRVRGELQKEYVNALSRIGVDVWYADHQFGFKDGEFVAVFA